MGRPKRYDPKYLPFSQAMYVDQLGIYVKYEDYEKLQSQLKEREDDLGDFLQWFLDNESDFEGDPQISDFVQMYLTSKDKQDEPGTI